MYEPVSNSRIERWIHAKLIFVGLALEPIKKVRELRKLQCQIGKV